MTEAVRETESPETENLNNFYMHLPGGMYRLDSDNPRSVPAIGTRFLFEKFGHLICEPEESWPSEHFGEIRQVKVNLEVQGAIDKILAEDAKLCAEIEELRRRGETDRKTSDPVLRPL